MRGGESLKCKKNECKEEKERAEREKRAESAQDRIQGNVSESMESKQN